MGTNGNGLASFAEHPADLRAEHQGTTRSFEHRVPLTDNDDELEDAA
jgi:hypothetical protein